MTACLEFSKAKHCSTVYMFHIFSIQSPLMVVINTAAINMWRKISLLHVDFILFAYKPRSRIEWLYDSSTFKFFSYPCDVFYDICTSLHFCQWSTGFSFFWILVDKYLPDYSCHNSMRHSSLWLWVPHSWWEVRQIIYCHIFWSFLCEWFINFHNTDILV